MSADVSTPSPPPSAGDSRQLSGLSTVKFRPRKHSFASLGMYGFNDSAEASRVADRREGYAKVIASHSRKPKRVTAGIADRIAWARWDRRIGLRGSDRLSYGRVAPNFNTIRRLALHYGFEIERRPGRWAVEIVIPTKLSKDRQLRFAAHIYRTPALKILRRIARRIDYRNL